MKENSISAPVFDPSPEPIPERSVKPKISEKELLRRKLISDYHAFANGGAQEQDTILHAKASTKEQSKKQKARKIAVGDLLGDDSSETVSYSKPGHDENIKPRDQGAGESESRGSSSTPQWSLLD